MAHPWSIPGSFEECFMYVMAHAFGPRIRHNVIAGCSTQASLKSWGYQSNDMCSNTMAHILFLGSSAGTSVGWYALKYQKSA